MALAWGRQTHSSLVPSRGSLLESLGPPGLRHAARSPGALPASAVRPHPASSVSPSLSIFLSPPNILQPLSLLSLSLSVSLSYLPVTCARSFLGSGLVSLGLSAAPPLPRSSPLFPGGVFPGLPSVSVPTSLLAPPPPSLDPPARSLSSPSSPPPLWPVGAGGPTFYPAPVRYPLPAGSRAPRVAAAPALSGGGGRSGGRALLL